jgi:hypothetical protein
MGCLLKGRGLYDSATASSVMPFRNSAVSLPSGVREAPLLRTILSPQDANLLERFEEEMLRPTIEVERINFLQGEPNVYTDVRLKSNAKLYANFVKRCEKIGIINFTTKCKCECGVFFCQKEAQQNPPHFRLPGAK